MINIEMFIEGSMPILLHRATEEDLTGKTRVNAAQEQDDPRTICDGHIYRMPNSKQIALPGAAFARLAREAGGNHKVKGSRKSLKYLVPAAIVIMDDLCPFFLRDRKTPIVDFEVDARPVTIPATKGKVMRYRARLNEWVARVNIRLNEGLISEIQARDLFREGGQQIGVGDFRPEKGGPFGIWSIVSWLNTSEIKQTPARARNGARAEA